MEQQQIKLDGKSLQPEDLYKISKGGYEIELSQDTWTRIKRARKVIEDIVQKKEIVYGVNTGFGNFANTVIPQEDLQKLQVNLIRSHSSGVDEPLSIQRTRMLLALRINVLSKGYSGISEETLRIYIETFNKDILPYIPIKGTVGASGDLAPLAHLALGLLGEGQVWDFDSSKYVDSKEICQKKKFRKIALKEKEGLALINGTQFITSQGAEAIVRAEVIAKTSDLIAGMSGEVLYSKSDSISLKISELSAHEGQKEVAQRLRRLLFDESGEGSQMNKELTKLKKKKNVDPISILCVPKVHGSSHDMLKFVKQVITNEMNAATDNPLVFRKDDEEVQMDRDCMLSGGNFHGEYPAKVLDYLAIAIGELGSISERRLERLLNPALSHLDDFLILRGGINNGFMISQCTAAALVSENKTLSHPASIDSITTSANQEDHVSMGGWAARKSLMIIQNVEYILAIELMAVCQAIDLLRPLKSTQRIQKIYEYVRQKIPYISEDVVFTPFIEKIAEMIKQGEILKVFENS